MLISSTFYQNPFSNLQGSPRQRRKSVNNLDALEMIKRIKLITNIVHDPLMALPTQMQRQDFKESTMKREKLKIEKLEIGKY